MVLNKLVCEVLGWWSGVISFASIGMPLIDTVHFGVKYLSKEPLKIPSSLPERS